jgi:predicted metal-dependent HD superfamily phosphohydrolase
MTATDLKSRFGRLWRRCQTGPSADDDKSAWRELHRRYGEPARHYHDMSHLAHCLAQHDAAAAGMDRPDTVEMAIWYHDIVLLPGCADNEYRSAELFRQRASGLFPAAFVDAVHTLIQSTDHRGPPRDLDGRYLADIDLSGFGLPWEAYLRDTLNLRREQPSAPAEHYHQGHHAFLNGLLALEWIFYTGHFRDNYEQKARENIRQYLNRPDLWR